MLTRDGKSFVWVVTVDESKPAARREGTVALRPVSTAPADDDRLSVVSGLAAGERVVMAGVHSLEEGQTVAVPADADAGGDVL